MGGTAAALVLCALAGGAPSVGCSESDHPGSLAPYRFGSSSGDPDTFDAGLPDGPPPCPETEGLCACEQVEAVSDAPNLYFVLDASGSMNAPSGQGGSRYDAMRDAAVDLVRGLGPLIQVGAAVFPDKPHTMQCGAGAEVFPVTPGDPVTGGDGPTTTAFRKAITRAPLGGTPTSATLTALAEGLAALDRRTIVLLATDGGPNCNFDAACGAAECIPNLEYDANDPDPACDPSTNCCLPGAYYGPGSCLDREATVAAVGALAAAGIEVYVIGIPGSETYEPTLDEMAKAGGGDPPEGGTTAYHKVDDLAALGAVFSKIASIAVSCDFDLGPTIPAKELTNVYLDKVLLPYDPLDGWAWLTDTQLALRGGACAKLKAGQVKEVQIVAGCPTEGPK